MQAIWETSSPQDQAIDSESQVRSAFFNLKSSIAPLHSLQYGICRNSDEKARYSTHSCRKSVMTYSCPLKVRTLDDCCRIDPLISVTSAATIRVIEGGYR